VVSADTLGGAELIGTKKGFGKNTVSPCWACDVKRGEHCCTNSFVSPSAPSQFAARTQETYDSQKVYAEGRTDVVKPPKPKRKPGDPPNPPKPPKRKPGDPPNPPKPPKPPPCTHGDSCCCTRKEYMTSVGINTFDHAFSRIPLFREMCSLPRDLMHCEPGGNLQVHGYAFIFMGIKLNWFTRNTVNRMIRRAQSNHFRVPTIPKVSLTGKMLGLPDPAGHLPYTSGQMIQFTLHIGEILRPLLGPAALNHPVYRAWVAHSRYFQAAMKNTFTTASILHLDSLIVDAQAKFLAIPEYKLLWKPKNHFAQHIPSDILMFGPPRGVWCMRFEAKNKEHKKAAKMGNYRDVANQIASFWVQKSAYRLKYFRRGRTKSTSSSADIGSETLDSSLSLEHKLYAATPGSMPGAVLTWMHCVNFLGQDLSAGTWVLLCPKSGDAAPRLAVIQSLFRVDQTGYLHVCVVTQPLHTGTDGLRYVKVSRESRNALFENVQLDVTDITILLSSVHNGKRRFVELP
jgi:hypothetical protein